MAVVLVCVLSGCLASVTAVGLLVISKFVSLNEHFHTKNRQEALLEKHAPFDTKLINSTLNFIINVFCLCSQKMVAAQENVSVFLCSLFCSSLASDLN